MKPSVYLQLTPTAMDSPLAKTSTPRDILIIKGANHHHSIYMSILDYLETLNLSGLEAIF